MGGERPRASHLTSLSLPSLSLSSSLPPPSPLPPQYHPDKNRAPSAAKRMAEITNAYEVRAAHVRRGVARAM